MNAPICRRLKRLSGGICNRSSLRKGTKKDPAGGGNARFFASRPLRQDHGSGSGALEGRGRSFLSVLTSSATVREPPHRPFPSPSDSPPRPRRKHRPCPAICLKIVFLHQTRILVSLVVLIADAFPILIPAIEFVTSVSSMVQFVLKKEVYMDKANYKLGVMGNLAARFRRILSA